MLGFFMLAEPDANQSEALNLVTSDLSYLFVGTDKASENRKRITTLFPFFIIRRVSEQPSSNCLRENKTNKSVFRHPSSGEYLFWIIANVIVLFSAGTIEVAVLGSLIPFPVSTACQQDPCHCCQAGAVCQSLICLISGTGRFLIAAPFLPLVEIKCGACFQKCRNELISSEECMHLCNELFLDALQSISWPILKEEGIN